MKYAEIGRNMWFSSRRTSLFSFPPHTLCRIEYFTFLAFLVTLFFPLLPSSTPSFTICSWLASILCPSFSPHLPVFCATYPPPPPLYLCLGLVQPSSLFPYCLPFPLWALPSDPKPCSSLTPCSPKSACSTIGRSPPRFGGLRAVFWEVPPP